MEFRFGETVVVRRAAQPTDPDNPNRTVLDWANATDTPVEGCAVWLSGTDDLSDAEHSKGTFDYTIIMPTGTDVSQLDRLVVRGVEMIVAARPFPWRSPFTGWAPGIEVRANTRLPFNFVVDIHTGPRERRTNELGEFVYMNGPVFRPGVPVSITAVGVGRGTVTAGGQDVTLRSYTVRMDGAVTGVETSMFLVVTGAVEMGDPDMVGRVLEVLNLGDGNPNWAMERELICHVVLD